MNGETAVLFLHHMLNSCGMLEKKKKMTRIMKRKDMKLKTPRHARHLLSSRVLEMPFAPPFGVISQKETLFFFFFLTNVHFSVENLLIVHESNNLINDRH